MVRNFNRNCSYCGAEDAEGLAFVGEQRFCHGDDVEVTCYMLATWHLQGEEPNLLTDWSEIYEFEE